MKTITKTFYTDNHEMKKLKLGNSYNLLLSSEKGEFAPNQIQISWQEPEKKIEITESEFREKIRNIAPSYWTNELIEHISNKFFANREGQGE